MTYTVQARERTAQPFVGLRTLTTQAELSAQAADAFPRLFAHLERAGTPPAGPPFARYHGDGFDPERVDVEFAVPAQRPVDAAGDIAAGELEPTLVATTLHEGPYTGIERAYEAVSGWIQDRGHETAGPPQEIYLVHPAQAAPEDLRTEIAWPIR